jgi:hypothetical protein
MTSLNLAEAVATNSANCTTALWIWSGTGRFIQTNCRDMKRISYMIRKNSELRDINGAAEKITTPNVMRLLYICTFMSDKT